MVEHIPFEDKYITVEYELAAQMVIFCHGFGTRRNARGIFPDIIASLPKGFGYIMFDFYDVDEVTNTITMVPFAEQVRKLNAVLAWLRQQNGVMAAHIVAHSLGGIVVANLSPADIGAMLLLAPPTILTGSLRRRQFVGRPSAKRTDDGLWYIPRRDGTTTIINERLFDELEQLDAEGELVKLALFRTFTLVIAEADDILRDDDYTELMVMTTINCVGVQNASHNFEDAARPLLVQEVIAQLPTAT